MAEKKTTRTPKKTAAIAELEKTIKVNKKEVAENTETKEEIAAPSIEEITQPKEEITISEDLAEPSVKFPEEVTEVPEIKEEIAEIATPSVEEIAEPKCDKEIEAIAIDTSESYKEFVKGLSKVVVDLKKANPNLPDDKSKWSVEIVKDNKRHLIFKGGYAKALRWAENYCKEHNIPESDIRKIKK